LNILKPNTWTIPNIRPALAPKRLLAGLVINSPGWRLSIAVTLLSPNDLAPYVANCDLLIHELAHPQPEEIADFAEVTKYLTCCSATLVLNIAKPRKSGQNLCQTLLRQLTIAEDGTKVELKQTVDLLPEVNLL